MTPEMLTAIQGIILAILSGLAAIIAVAVPFAIKYFKAFCEAKTAKLDGENTRATAEFALSRLDHIVNNTVNEIQQTKTTGEPITKEKAKELITLAYNRVKVQMAPEIESVVKTIVKEPNRYIVTKLEAAIWKSKLAKTAADCK